MSETDEQFREEEEGAGDALPAPSPEDEQNLVALLDAGRPTKRFYLPTGKDTVSDVYFIEAQGWRMVDSQRYMGAGMDYRVQLGKGSRRGKGSQQTQAPAQFRMDSVVQFRALVESSITDYKLRLKRKDVNYTGAQSVWGVFGELPTPVGDWVQATLRKFHGIEMVEEGEEGEEPGEA